MLPTIRKVSVILNYTFSGGKTRYKVPFTDNEDLRNVKLWGVQTYYQIGIKGDGIVNSNPDFLGTNIDKPTFVNSFLTLYDINNVEFLKQAPFVIFQTIQNGTDERVRHEYGIVERDTKVFTGQFLDLQSSYIEVLTNNVFAGTYSFVIDFYYSRIDLDAQIKKN